LNITWSQGGAHGILGYRYYINKYEPSQFGDSGGQIKSAENVSYRRSSCNLEQETLI
jgi:hypothetical protein